MKETSGQGVGVRIAIASILIPIGIAVFCIGLQTFYPPDQALQHAYVTYGSLGQAVQAY